jgi:peroxiredoxin-like protein
MTAVTHIFKNDVKWEEGKKGILNFERKCKIEFSTPPSFGGPVGLLNPEDLFVASVNSCVLTSFLYFAEKLGLRFLSYTCRAEGIVEKTEGPFVFSNVKLDPTIVVKNESERTKATKAIELTDKYCIISNSIDNQIKVNIKPKVIIKG